MLSHALDRDELERAADAITEAVGSIDEVYNDELADLGTGTTTDSGSGTAPADTAPGNAGPGDSVVPEDAVDPYSECLQSTTTEEAADCFAAAIDAGVLPEGSMPVELEFPECGVGDVLLGVTTLYDMSDEEYTVLVTTANECFTALIASGAVDEFPVPGDYLHPECAEGRNPWSFDSDDDDLFEPLDRLHLRVARNVRSRWAVASGGDEDPHAAAARGRHGAGHPPRRRCPAVPAVERVEQGAHCRPR